MIEFLDYVKWAEDFLPVTDCHLLHPEVVRLFIYSIYDLGDVKE
jgi:hypothetical protein